MVYLTRKKKGQKYYLYLEESTWVNGRSKRLWQKYLGPEDRLRDLSVKNLFSKHLGDLKITTLEFGLSAALWQIAEKIGLSSIIDANTGKKRDQGLSVGEYITIAAINRCCKPVSKSKLGKWFEKDWLSTQYEINPKKKICQDMTFLYSHHDNGIFLVN